MVTDLSGQVVAGRYRILHCHSRDADVAVYRAELLLKERPVLMKVVVGPEMEHRLINELRVLALVDHPGTVDVFDMGKVGDDVFYSALEWLEGITLQDRLRHGEPFSTGQAVSLAVQLCDVVQAFHDSGHCLRQLCPADIMLCGARDSIRVWSALFAASLPDGGFRLRRAPSPRQIRAPGHTAPEMALGQVVDGRADVYTTGIMLYELLAGRPPFTGEAMELLQQQVNTPPPPLPQTLPGALVRVVQRALAKGPEARFESARAMQRELEAIALEITSRVSAPPAGCR